MYRRRGPTSFLVINSMARREIETYLRNEVTWSTRGDLVVRLYERAVRSLDVVLDSEFEVSSSLKQQELGRVVGILVELEAALDPATSEELANLLRRLYRTLRQQVVEASTGSSSHGLAEVREQLKGLLETWRQVTRQTDNINVRNIVDRRRKHRR